MDKKKIALYIFIGLLSLIMLSMAVVSFLCGEPPYKISTSIIYIFVIIAVLLVFDSVENLSIGNVFTLKNKVKEKEKEITKLNEENLQLRNQFISVMKNTFNSNASSQIYIGDSSGFIVQKAENEDKEKDNELTEEIIESTDSPITHKSTNQINRIKFRRLIEENLLNRFIKENDISEYIIQKEIKITSLVSGTDPIIEKDMVFDAYLKRPIDELFIEVSTINNPHSIMDFRLYFMISRVYHYSRANKVKAKTILIVPKYTQEYIDSCPEWLRFSNPSRLVERLKDMYMPAIKNDLLEVVEVDLSTDDMRSIEEKASI